jgi:predicted TIM-barrel fold metal-dependent hydrolase
MLTDAHAHIFPPAMISRREELVKEEPFFALMYKDPMSPMASAADLLAAMEEQGVARAWALGFTWQKEENARQHNDYLLQTRAGHPDKLRCLGAVWPPAGWAQAEAERILASGLDGLGEIGFYQSDLDLTALAPLADMAASLKRPLLLHINEPLGASYAGKAPMGLSRLYQLLRRHPATRFILSHLGGGIFFYALLKKEMPAILANVWLDSAAAPFIYKPRALKLAVELMGADKVLLGSDFPLLSVSKTLSLLQQAGLNQEEMDMVCQGAAGALIA